MARQLVSALLLAAALAPPGVVAAQQLRPVVGRVVRADGGAPVLGATITQVGVERRGTLGDGQGRFRLLVSDGPVTLHVRAIGYLPKDLPVAASDTAVTVALVEDALKLDQVVVTGAATTIVRGSAPTSSAVVDSADLTRAPAATVDLALQGKVAGARIETNSGAPGGGVQVQIRGVNTIIGGSDPLFVVDGVIYSNASIPTGVYSVSGSGNNDGTGPAQDDAANRLADLNPDDIESIEVMKSAAASSIYGSKAANGVVIITTKRGKAGKPRITVTQRTGFSHLLRGPASRVFTIPQADSLYGAAAVAPYIVNGKLPFYDHLEDIAGRTPLNSQTLLDVSGGSDNTRYYIAGSSTQDGGIMINTNARRNGARVNIDQHLGRDFEASLSTNWTATNENRGFANNDNNGASAPYAIAYIPSFEPLTRSGGVFPQPAITYSGANPLQTLDEGVNNDKVNRFVGGAHLSWNPIHGGASNLTFVAAGGLDNFDEIGTVTMPADVYFQANQPLPGVSTLANAANRQYNWNANAIYAYTAPNNLFKSSTSGGIQFEDQELNLSRVTTLGLIGSQTQIDNGSSVSPFEYNEHDRAFAPYAQEEFTTLQDRLVIEGGVRAERNSNNGSTGAYYFYPKVAAAYRFSDLFGQGSALKLRSAYGETGNQPLFGQKFTLLNASSTIGGVPGYSFTDGQVVADPHLTPERTRELEAGFDASAFHERASLEFTWYRRRTSNLFLPRTPAPSTGAGSIIENGGVIQNRGFEVGSTLIPIQVRDFTWTFNTTWSTNRGIVEALPGNNTYRPSSAGFGLAYGEYLVQVGRPITQIIGYCPGPGGTTNTCYLGQNAPDWDWTFGSTFTLGRWSLGGLFDWRYGGVAQNQTYSLYACNGLAANYESAAGQYAYNACNNGTDARPFVPSTSFLKLRELTLTYQLPTRYSRYVFGSNDIKLSASGRNLILITKYYGYDPEVSNFGQEAVTRGVDLAPYPPSRSFFFTVSAGF